jgi:rRNA maturation protein Nop10
MRIRYCGRCDKYTLREKCLCGSATKLRTPAKFKPDDKYEHYRRDAKWNEKTKRNE